MSGEIGLLNFLSLALTPFVAIVFFLLGISRRRPLLITSGGGSGGEKIGEEQYDVRRIAISNYPRFFGIKVPREPARIVMAFLRDRERRHNIGVVLKWRDPETGELESKWEIGPGDRAELLLLAKEHSSGDLIVYNPHRRGELPTDVRRLRGEKFELQLVLRDNIGREYKFNITVLNRDRHFSIISHITLRSRVQMVREAMSNLREAFSFRKYDY